MKSWEEEYAERQLKDLAREQAALQSIRSFARENKDALSMLWARGDGDGGGVLDMLAEEAGIPRGFGERRAPAKTKAVISAGLRTQVFERDAYRCKHCGTHKDLRADHIHPESKGGPTTLENLQTLCAPCNSKKGARI